MTTLKPTLSRSLFSIAILALLGAWIQFSGCKKTEDKTAGFDSLNTTPTLDNTYVAEYTTFRTQTEQQLAANRDSIKAYQVRIKTAKAKAKANLERERLDLERRNAELEAELAEYKDEGKDKDRWEKFKHGFSRRADSVGSGIKNFVKKITHDDYDKDGH